MFYTSYFGNKKNFPQGALICGICRYPPDGVINLIGLAPQEELLKKLKSKDIDEFIFSYNYEKQLDDNKEQIRKFFQEVDKDVVLCCYEKTGDFCHRHILSNWLIKNNIIKEIKEL